MRKIVSHAFLGVLPMLAFHMTAQAGTKQWSGETSNDIQQVRGWSPASMPGSDDTAYFAETAKSKNPILQSGTFAVQALEFPDATSFKLTITTSQMKLLGRGVITQGNTPQAIAVDKVGTLLFSNHAQAGNSFAHYNAKNGGIIVFDQFSKASSAQFHIYVNSQITFLDHSTAGSALIRSHQEGQVVFSGHANAENASIQNQDGTVVFFNNATAGYSTIELRNSALRFHNTSTTDHATINAQDTLIQYLNSSTAQSATLNLINSRVLFQGASQGGQAQINLRQNSLCKLYEDNTLGSLSSDATSTLDLQEFRLSVGSNHADTTLEGGVIGTGSLEKVGAGTLTLLGSNTYSGGTVVKEGTLKGNTTSLQGHIANQANIVVDQSSHGTFKGTLSGTGSLRVQGGGTVVINTDNAGFTGTTVIQDSHLVLNNTLGASIDVQNGGNLSGTGTVGKDVVVHQGGSLTAPYGTQPLRISGNLIHSRGSFYAPQVGSDGTCGHIQVAGVAHLQGGKVQITSANGLYRVGPKLRILHAVGGVQGRFAKVSTSNAYFVPTLKYDNNNAYVGFHTNFSRVAQSSLQKRIAAQFDSIRLATNQQQTIINTLACLDAEQVRKSLEAMSGHQYTNLMQISQQANRRFMRQLYDPIQYSQDTCDSSVQVWSEVNGGRGFLSSTHRAKGYRIDKYDATIGAQTNISSNFVAGAAASYEHDQLDFNGGGSGHAQSYQGALYANFQQPCYYLFSDVIFGQTQFKIHRDIDCGSSKHQLHSKPCITHTTWYVEGGRNFTCYDYLIQPFAGMELGYYRLNHFHEHGTLGLDVKSKSVNTWNSRLGFHFSGNLPSCLILNADLAWLHCYRSQGNKIHAHFADSEHGFSVDGVNIGRDALEGSINIGKRINDNVSLYGEFSGEKWQEFTTYEFGMGLISEW